MSVATKHRLAHWSYSIHCALQPMPFHSFPIMTACQQRTPYSNPLCQHTRRCILICRQQETGLQCKPGSRGHHAHSLGQPEQHGSICVLDMDLKNEPVQIDNNDLNQTNHDHAGLDIKNGTIIDPDFLQFKLNVESTVEPSVEEVLDHSSLGRYRQGTPRRCSSPGTSANSAHASSSSESSA